MSFYPIFLNPKLKVPSFNGILQVTKDEPYRLIFETIKTPVLFGCFIISSFNSGFDIALAAVQTNLESVIACATPGVTALSSVRTWDKLPVALYNFHQHIFKG